MKEKKGISLIVLIVTIIVMIIIAGAVIISLTETNIIDQAEDAVEKHNESEIQTAASMAYADWVLKTNTAKLEERKNIPDVQTYVRNELINQNVLSWEESANYYITDDGKIEEMDEETFSCMVEITRPGNYWIGIFGTGSTSAQVDWGNGTTSSYTNSDVLTEYEPGIYEIKITGKNIDQLRFEQIENITEIKSWGNLEVENILFIATNKLKYIAAPNSKSFSKLKDFTLVSETLEYLPDEMFKNCTNLSQVYILGCTSLKYIPDNLFKNLDTSKIYINFKGCTSASNYNSIPDEWKQ